MDAQPAKKEKKQDSNQEKLLAKKKIDEMEEQNRRDEEQIKHIKETYPDTWLFHYHDLMLKEEKRETLNESANKVVSELSLGSALRFDKSMSAETPDFYPIGGAPLAQTQ
mmetsp:Transcript_15772/g.26623  ORF Transcript_15772/g.26623 Transcript_15772/m.26623 type:complete len:110 (-) Transcript_15772:253-582(-)